MSDRAARLASIVAAIAENDPTPFAAVKSIQVEYDVAKSTAIGYIEHLKTTGRVRLVAGKLVAAEDAKPIQVAGKRGGNGGQPETEDAGRQQTLLEQRVAALERRVDEMEARWEG